jgi:hypothetical protein
MPHVGQTLALTSREQRERSAAAPRVRALARAHEIPVQQNLHEWKTMPADVKFSGLVQFFSSTGLP